MLTSSRPAVRCLSGRRWRLIALAALAFLVSVPAGALEVSGRVVDEAGAPIPGATVELQRILSLYERSRQVLEGKVARESTARVRTSADGEFRLAVPEAGMWQFEISAEASVSVRHRLTPILQDEVLPDAVLEADVGLDVRIENSDGTALAGAQVWVRPIETKTPGFRRQERSPWRATGRYGRTGSDGRVRLARSEEQTVSVHAFASGFLPAKSGEVEAGSTTLGLLSGSPVTIRVTAASGEPISDGLLSAGSLNWVATATGKEGEAVLFVAPDEPLPVTLQLATGQIEATEIRVAAADLGRQPQVQIVREWRLPAAVELAGSVVDEDTRAALSGALVWPSNDVGQFEVSDVDGRYTLLRGSGERWVLRAGASGYTDSGVEAERQATGLRVPTLALARAGAVAGRVVDPLGEPIADAVVRVASRVGPRSGPARSSSAHRSATSSSNGSFRLEGLTVGDTFELATEASGFAPDHRRLTVEAGTEVEIVLQPGRSIIGRLVTPDQEAVVGGRVFAMPIEPDPRMWAFSSRTEPNPQAESDAEGRFRLDDLPRRPMVLVARRDGLADKMIRDVDLAEAEAPLDLGDIELGWGVELHGVVRSRDGQAIADAKVMIFGSASDLLQGIRFQEDSRRETQTDYEGRFEVKGLSANVRHNASVTHPDYVDRFVSEIDPGAAEPLEIVLDRGARVSGRVLDASGAPVENVSVSVATMSFEEPSTNPMAMGSAMTRGRSRADGSFEATGISAGRLEISVIPGRGWLVREPIALTVAAGEERKDLVLRVTKGATLTGAITNNNGRPVVGASIQVGGKASISMIGMMRGTASFGANGKTDGDGVYSIQGLDPGTAGVVITIRHPGFAPLEQSFELRPGLNRLDLVLQRGASISGGVVDEGGEPVEGAQIDIQTTASWSGSFSMGSSPRAESGGDGSFEITGVSAGVYQLVARKSGFAASVAESVETSDDAGAYVTLTLRRGGTIHGRIVGLEPDDLGQVQVFATGGSVGGAAGAAAGLVSDDAEYRIPNVGFAEGQVMATSRRSGQVVVEPFTLDTRGGETWLDLEFGVGSSLTGVVKMNGKPTTGAQVIAQGQTGGVGSAMTDTVGRFRIEGLEDGEYLFMVMSTGLPRHTEQVRVAGNTEVTIDIATVRLSGRVIAEEGGEPISGAYISVTVEDDPVTSFSSAQAATTIGGEFEVDVAAGRRVLLRAKADGFAEGSMEFDTVSGVAISGIELTLGGGDALELEVALWTGMRPDFLSVALVDASGSRIVADNLLGRPAGRYRLQSAPRGDWTLLVAARGSAVVARKVTIPGPSVELVLPQGATISVEIASQAGETPGGTLRVVSAGGGILRLPISGHVLSEMPVFGSQTQIPFVPAGDWLLELTDSTGTVRRQAVTTIAGETSPVTFQ